jgi:hypothetical protein
VCVCIGAQKIVEVSCIGILDLFVFNLHSCTYNITCRFLWNTLIIKSILYCILTSVHLSLQWIRCVWATVCTLPKQQHCYLSRILEILGAWTFPLHVALSSPNTFYFSVTLIHTHTHTHTHTRTHTLTFELAGNQVTFMCNVFFCVVHGKIVLNGYGPEAFQYNIFNSTLTHMCTHTHTCKTSSLTITNLEENVLLSLLVVYYHCEVFTLFSCFNSHLTHLCDTT